MRRLTHRPSAVPRLAAAAGLSAVALLTALVIPSGGLTGLDRRFRGRRCRADGYKKAYAAKAAEKTSAAQGSGTIFRADGTHPHPNALVDDGHSHSHNDPATKNAVSRAALTTDAETADPTTPTQARLAVGAAADQRDEPEPALSNVPVSPPHAASPTNRYNMFNACYGLQSSRTGRWLTDSNVPTFAAASSGAGTPLYFKPTALGRYMLYSPDRTYLDGGRSPVGYAASPSPTSDWVVQMPRSGLFSFQIPGHGYLTDGPDNATMSGTPTLLRLRLAQRLHRVPRGHHQRLGQPVLRRQQHPGGAWLHRRAHPRDGLRVPRRRGALRPALVAVRRRDGAQGLPRPLDDQRLRRPDGELPVRHQRPRPGRLADVQGLAGARSP